MVFPFLVVLMSFAGRWLRLCLLVAIAASYLWIMFDLQPAFWAQRWADLGLPDSLPYPTGTIDVITGAAVLRCMCGFVLGILVYELYQKQTFQPLLQSSWVFSLTWICLLVGWHFDVIYDPVAVLLFAVIILSLAFNRGRLGVFIDGRCFQFLGDISYSLYLVHMPIIMTFIVYRKAVYYPDAQESAAGVGYMFSLMQSWLGLLAFLVVTITLSALSYRFIEKPARRYLKGKQPASLKT
jgi:peptidoglycan/LPS O-acetylase OafA/YrhL